MPETTPRLYANRAVGLLYDALNAAIWLPGGSGALRSAFVDAIRIQPGEEVLELGCGTGLVTERLVAAGAAVTAIDSSPAMLDRARRRAPTATFETVDLRSYQPGSLFDVLALPFVLHELEAPSRRSLLSSAHQLLRHDGRIAVLDWTLPKGGPVPRPWRTFIRALEPSSALEVVDGALDGELVEASWKVDRRRPLASGRAEVLIAQRSRDSTPWSGSA